MSAQSKNVISCNVLTLRVRGLEREETPMAWPSSCYSLPRGLGSNFTSQSPNRLRPSFQKKVSVHYQDNLQGDFSCLRNSDPAQVYLNQCCVWCLCFSSTTFWTFIRGNRYLAVLARWLAWLIKILTVRKKQSELSGKGFPCQAVSHDFPGLQNSAIKWLSFIDITSLVLGSGKARKYGN